MKALFSFLFLLAAYTGYAQPTDQLIQIEDFKEELLHSFLMEDLDSLRSSKKLPLLIHDEMLEAAAFKQSEFLIEASSLSHEQDNSKFKSLQDRVSYFGGRFYALGENIILLNVNQENSNKRSSRQQVVRTYAEAANAAIASWMEKDESKLNLLDPEFYKLGISTIVNPTTQQLIICVVFGSAHYENSYKIQDISKIGEYDKNKCASFLKEFPDLPQLFSEAVKVRNSKVVFDSPNAYKLKAILKENTDALAFDILCRRQFECGRGNSLFPGEVQDGYLSPSIGKSKIHSMLEAGDSVLVLGNLPAFYQHENCEINIKIIKENVLCETVPHNIYGGKNISWLSPEMLQSLPMDTAESFTWKDSQSYQIALDQKSISSLDSVLTYGSALGINLLKANVKFSLSPISKPKPNEIEHYKSLIQQELQKFGNPPITYKVVQNWKAYADFASNRVYSLESRGMDTLEIVEYLKEEAKSDEVLKNFMEKLDFIELDIVAAHQLKEQKLSKQKALYRQFVKKEKTVPALHLQTNLYSRANEEELKEISLEVLPRKKEYLDLINNQLLFIHQHYPQKFDEGKNLQQSYRELKSIDPSNKIISYNYLYAQLKNWSEDLSRVEDPEKWLSDFNSLNDSLLPQEKMQVLLLNYHILMADHYYETSAVREREKALESIYNTIKKKELSEEEANFYAEYLMFQLQIPWAIELLKKYALKENPSKNTLENILSLKIYDQGVLSSEQWMSLFEKMAALYPQDFCAIFNKDKIGFQQLKDMQLKSLYCGHCD